MTDANTAADAATEGQVPEGGARPADQPTAAQDAARSVVVAPKQQLIATSDVAIWDAAAFQQMGRVGRLMADSGLANETLFKDGERPAPEHMVLARMVMIANLAREVGANPLMLLQTASIISRKLHLEGKAVAAIVTQRTGVKLKYRFGVWNTDHIEFPPAVPLIGEDGEPVINPATDKPFMVPDQTYFHGVGERLAVRCYDPADPERFVDGSVGAWKTDRPGSPWKNSNNWRRQLRYRSAPEWARAYEPGAILGFYSDADEDLEDIGPAQPRGRAPKRDLAAKLTNQGHGGEHGPEGFDHGHVASLGEKTQTEAHDADGGVQDAEFTDGGREAQPEPAVLQLRAEALAKIAPNDETAEEILVRLEAGEASGDTILDGHAEEGEQYLLAGDGLDASARRLTYKDGARFSAVKSYGKFRCYAIHAPELEDDDAEGLQGISAAQDRLDAERPDPQTAATAAGWDQFASGVGGIGFRKVGAAQIDRSVQTHPGTGWELVYGDIDSGEMIGDGSEAAGRAEAARRQQAADAAQAGAQAEPAEAAAPAEDSFLGRCRAAESWAGIKAEYGQMAKTTDWIGAGEAERDEVRRGIWAEVARVKRDHRDPVDHATDPTAFGIWLATQPKTRDGADAVEGTFAVLKSQPIWGQMTPAQHKALEDRVAPFLQSARG